MASLREHLVPIRDYEDAPPRTWAGKARGGLIGLLATASGLLGLKHVWGVTRSDAQPFTPSKGLEAVLVRPALLQDMPASPMAPTAVLLYGALEADVLSELEEGARVQDVVLYGVRPARAASSAQLSHHKPQTWAAQPTGYGEDVLTGKLLTWSLPSAFGSQLQWLDGHLNYDPLHPLQGNLRRAVATAVAADGRALPTFFYYSSPAGAGGAAGGPASKTHDVAAAHDPNCIFCKIVKGDIPSFKVHETEKTLAFMDVFPLSRGHVLVIPKHHAVKAHELPEDSMADIGRVLHKVTKGVLQATGVEDYNILQNNGELAHQVVKHVHFHVIPKPDQTQGLGVGWPAKEGDKAQLKLLSEEIKASIKQGL